MTVDFFQGRLPQSRHVCLVLLFVASAVWPVFAERTPVTTGAPLTVVELQERDGQILSYRHLAGSTDVHMRGTRRAPEARIKLKIGSRPGFVELDINRGGIEGLKPAHRLGKDFLTYVLWAVSVDGRASNLGEITFDGDRAVPVNLTTPYQTFWLMVTAEPSFAVVDPSPHVVLYSVNDASASESKALTIRGNLFFFTHYAAYESVPADRPEHVPNQLLQARKAVELASRSGVVAVPRSESAGLKEEDYTREALAQARTFLNRAENAYRKNPDGQEVIQFARTAAQSAENARALAMGAVGGLVVRQLENELVSLRNELETLKAAGRSSPASPAAEPRMLIASPPLVKQPALWFAVAGWAFAIVLLFRQRPV